MHAHLFQNPIICELSYFVCVLVRMRTLARWTVIFGSVYLIFSLVAGAIVGEASVHLWHRPIAHRAEASARIRELYKVDLQDVATAAGDGASLKGWYVRPRNFNGSAVILLHGITDNREGVIGYGRIFLDRGYAVLAPDARGHGESGGDVATYGLKDSDDIRRWVNWLYARDLAPAACVYGFGESYGAALILQSLADEPRFCAVVAESSFSTAREVSFERLSGFLHLGPWFGRTLGRPIVSTAVLYAKWRYGIDLLRPSPLDAVEHSTVPVLLIHGERDRDISPRHSLILAHAAQDHVELWLVPNAGHTGAWAAAHNEFESRVAAWFQTHPRVAAPSSVTLSQ
jgi:dipeptidyl aminopeptidase/acylaminoacyl peptidase